MAVTGAEPRPAEVSEGRSRDKRKVGIQEASFVYVQEGAAIGLLDAMYRGPYRVLVRERKKLLLEIGATQTWVSVDQLKPHTGAATPAAAQPPRVGVR